MPSQSHRIPISFPILLIWIACAAVIVYYLFLTCHGGFDLFGREPLGYAYNNMLLHLLNFDFTIDPSAISEEAFIRNGKVYTYFGVLPALLRLPMLPFIDLHNVVVSRLLCLTAILISAWAQISTLAVIYKRLPHNRTNSWLFAVLICVTLFSAPQLSMTFSSWAYNEPIVWAAAFALLFNRIVIERSLSDIGFRQRDYCFLAVLAGSVVLARPPIAVGLVAGLGFLLFLEFRKNAELPLSASLANNHRASIVGSVFRPLLARNVIYPLVIVTCFVAIAGFINFERFGSPFSFMDYRYYGQMLESPRRQAVYETYGAFSLLRIPVSILYYFFAMPFRPQLNDFINSHFDDVAWPRSAFIATSTITLWLSSYGIWHLIRRDRLSHQAALPIRGVIAGHGLTVVLMLSLMAQNYRYRIDFLPFFSLASTVGFLIYGLKPVMGPTPWRKFVVPVVVMVGLINILISHVDLYFATQASFAVSSEIRDHIRDRVERVIGVLTFDGL